MTAEAGARERSRRQLARVLTKIEAGDPDTVAAVPALAVDADDSWIVGLTGAPGAGKSTLISAVLVHLRRLGQRVAVLAVDPSSPLTGGALLGDRIRMGDHIGDPDVFIRSLASRGQLGGLALAVPAAVRAVVAAGYQWVLVETVGVGQSAVDLAGLADTVVLLVAPGAGDSVQAGKAGVNEVADAFVVNKADQEGAREAARDLEGSLRLALRKPQSWRPPVLLTQAVDGEGIAELVDVVARHREHSIGSGDARRRRQARRVIEWRELCTTLLLQHLEEAISDDDGSVLADQVAAGRRDPPEAAQLLVHRLLTEGPR
jgi:LAO/AO transport system kinase